MPPLLLDSAPEATSFEGSSLGSLTVHSQTAVVPVEARLELLRKDREVHRHKQIWTKDPHGGPYKKARWLGKLAVLAEPEGVLRFGQT